MSFVATPTKTVPATVARALQLVQKTNSWTKSTDLSQVKDSQGKTRSSFCLRGALRAAVGGKTQAAEVVAGGTKSKLVSRSASAIMKTVNANLGRYGLSDGDQTNSIVAFNDHSQTEHKHVVRALRDTLARLDSTSAPTSFTY